MSFEITPSLVGCSVAIETAAGIVEGEVRSVDPNCSKIYILNGTLNSNKLPGVYRIFTRDVNMIHVKGEVSQPKEKTTAPNASGIVSPPLKQIANMCISPPKQASYKNTVQRMQKNMPPHIMNLDNKIEVAVLTNKLPQRGSNDQLCSIAITDYTIIRNIDENYEEMISTLKENTMIGLSMEGVRVGRHGIVCWIGVGIKDHAFLIDMCSLGPAGVNSGLKEILENPDVKKIVHDCRFMSDAFVHQYQVKVENVLDTQVAAAVVEKSKHGAFNRYAPSLTRCLHDYLGMPVEVMFQPRMRIGHELEDESRWKLKPLPIHLEHGAVFNVCHLKTLYLRLLERMLEEVTAGTQLYLKEVSELSDDECLEKAVVPHLIPVSFEKLVKQSNPQNGTQFYSSVPENSCDPYLRFSRHIPHINKPNVYL